MMRVSNGIRGAAGLLPWLAAALPAVLAAQEGAGAPATEPGGPVVGTFDGFLTQMRELVGQHVDLSGLNLWDIGYFVVVLLVAMVAGQVVRWVIHHHMMKVAAKTETKADDIFLEAISAPLSLLAMSIGLFLGAMPLMAALSVGLQAIYHRFCLALGAVAIAWALYRMVAIIDYLLGNLAAKTETKLDDMLVAIVRKALRVAVAVLAVLFIGQNILGLNITALLGAAGVAGLAIAFAAQDTISNFFGSVMIILDQPFAVGDRVVINGTEGIVESVGFRTTRLKNLDGHAITIPNKQVADGIVINIGRRPHIKQTVNFTVVYDTPPAKMDEALAILHEIYDGHEGMAPDFPPRICFNAFNDWSLNLLVITWYHPPDYWKYMDWNQRCNLEVLRRFNAAGIEFAFPTSTTYLAQDGKRRLDVAVETRGAGRTGAKA